MFWQLLKMVKYLRNKMSIGLKNLYLYQIKDKSILIKREVFADFGAKFCPVLGWVLNSYKWVAK